VATKLGVAARGLALILVLLVLSPTGPVSALAQSTEALNVVTATRVIGDETRTRFIADLTDAVDVHVFALADPYRIVIDLPEVHFQLDPGTGDTGFALISAYRYGLISRGQSRIVLDVTQPVALADSFVIPAVAGQPARLVIDLVTTSREAFLAGALDYQQNGGNQAVAPQPPMNDNFDDDRLVVVIDPGHGGIDSGAVGPSNVLEKDVVLAFAQELAAQLRATGRYEVLLTRDDDTYVGLTDRVDFARNAGADLFLSIHSNSFPQQPSIGGTSVFTVSEQASNQMVADLAARENRADILAGVNAQDTTNDVVDILLDLARRETKNFSIIAARDIIDHLRGTVSLFHDPLQEAGFVVLKAPDVPSVLVELGFISNPQDEELLQSDDWRRQTASAMVAAVADFFDTRVAINAH
jgi:N-acetylmuramoyl-L-alanine amidase